MWFLARDRWHLLHELPGGENARLRALGDIRCPRHRILDLRLK